MSQRKTAEEILKIYLKKGAENEGRPMSDEHVDRVFNEEKQFLESITSAIQEYAKQEVEARDELIKELQNSLFMLTLAFMPQCPADKAVLEKAKKVLTKAQSFNQE